jgi:hypothetical protein
MCLRRAPEKYIAGAALDRAELKDWLMSSISKRPNRIGSPSPHLKTEADSVSETFNSSYSELRTMDKIQKPCDSEG